MTGYLKRMRVYFGEMFSLPGYLLVAVLIYLSVAGFARLAHEKDSGLLSLHSAAGVGTVFVLFLMMRLMDDLKDREIDKVLFPERPLPSGRVFERDIRGTLMAAIAAYLLVTALLGQALWSGLVVLAYLLLMFKLFFVPDILRRSLPLSLATHAPIIPLLLLHGFMIFADEHEMSATSLRWHLILPYTAMIWVAIESWEVSRKIRAPTEETEYMTYSRLIGSAGAVLVAGGLQALAAGIAIWFFASLSLSGIYLGLVLGALALVLAANFRFLLRPDPRTAKLRPFCEAFAVLFLAAQVLEFGWLAR
jgi:4-hydroxybenzoate polyprenyltransferase